MEFQFVIVMLLTTSVRFCINDCEDCDSGCADKNFHFTIYKWKESLAFGFIHVTPKCTIAQTSESIAINYCPWCGEKISEQEVSFEKCCVEKLFPTEW